MMTNYDQLKEEHQAILKEFFEDFSFADEDSMAETVNDVYHGKWENLEEFAMDILVGSYGIDLGEFPNNCISPGKVWDWFSQDFVSYEDENGYQHVFHACF